MVIKLQYTTLGSAKVQDCPENQNVSSHLASLCMSLVLSVSAVSGVIPSSPIKAKWSEWSETFSKDNHGERFTTSH